MSSTCAHSDCFKSALRGAVHGLWYGAKVRFCHAIVITILFRKGGLLQKMISVIKLTKEHSVRLAIYVFFYKSIQCCITHFRGKKTPTNALIAGALVGYKVFGEPTSVNMQIVFYLLSRVLAGSADVVYSRDLIISKHPMIKTWAFPALATSCWALVMYLFELQKDSLQESLTSSMSYLYLQSDKELVLQL